MCQEASQKCGLLWCCCLSVCLFVEASGRPSSDGVSPATDQLPVHTSAALDFSRSVTSMLAWYSSGLFLKGSILTTLMSGNRAGTFGPQAVLKKVNTAQVAFLLQLEMCQLLGSLSDNMLCIRKCKMQEACAAAALPACVQTWSHSILYVMRVLHADI